MIWRRTTKELTYSTTTQSHTYSTYSSENVSTVGMKTGTKRAPQQQQQKRKKQERKKVSRLGKIGRKYITSLKFKKKQITTSKQQCQNVYSGII